MSTAALGFQVVEEIARRLKWDGAPDDFPDAASFLARGAEGQRNRLVVFLLSERAAESRGGRRAVVQVVTAEIGLLLLLPRRNDRGGQKARGKAEAFVDAARRRLLSWTPPSLKRPLAWNGGALEPFGDDDSYWVWLDRYQAEWALDSQHFNGA